MKIILAFCFAVLLLVSCSSEKDPQVVMNSFWGYVNEWNQGDPEAASKACAFLSEKALSGYSQQDKCVVALRSAFSPWGGKDVYRVATTKDGRWVDVAGAQVFVQPLVLFVRENSQKTVYQVEAAAVMSSQKEIESLAGMAYPVLLPDRDLSPSSLDMAILGAK